MKFTLFFYLFIFLFSNSYQECSDYKEEESCINHNLQSENINCCFMSLNESNFECIDKPEFIEFFNADKKIKPLFREFIGYSTNGEYGSLIGEENKKANVICKDFNNEVDFSEFYYSKEEKEIFKSEDHCFNYHNLTFGENELEPIKNLCNNGKFTKYATDAGLKCAYVEITFIPMKESNPLNIKTCFPFIKEDAKNEVLNQFTKSYFDSLATQFNAFYTLNAVVQNEISVNYDSKTGKLTDNNKNNKSNVVKIYNFLIILLIFLF